ncbi:hypothetical protein [Oceanimonas marisflavi]|uniref:hypothetical protein n=1 Tax=Oceanimonas marisflavi TaxID=2059724 RepID=UPI001E527110|nr:hypothetical protein [Oceanimonas marisflavi]
MLILSALMAAMVILSGQSSRQLVYEVQALKARLAAEAVLEQKVFALLSDIDAREAVENNVNGCDANAIVPTSNKEAGVTQVNVIATGTCTGSGLTVIRNIEVEVIE